MDGFSSGLVTVWGYVVLGQLSSQRQPLYFGVVFEYMCGCLLRHVAIKPQEDTAGLPKVTRENQGLPGIRFRPATVGPTSQVSPLRHISSSTETYIHTPPTVCPQRRGLMASQRVPRPGLAAHRRPILDVIREDFPHLSSAPPPYLDRKTLVHPISARRTRRSFRPMKSRKRAMGASPSVAFFTQATH